MRESRRNKKGFTLIELVIVVAVLAIIAVIAVPTVGNIITDAKSSSDKSQVALMQSAIERYKTENGAYPADAAAAKTAISTWTNLGDTIDAPKGGTSGQAFIYTITTTSTSTSAKISIGTPTTPSSNAVSAVKGS